MKIHAGVTTVMMMVAVMTLMVVSLTRSDQLLATPAGQKNVFLHMH